MKRFLKDYRLHEYTEALFLLTLGIVIQVLDGSPLDVQHRWTLAWETEFPREYFSAFIQKIIKTVLSMIILVRCLTSVLYVLSGFVVAYCILKETSPKLMLPWLFISGFKSVLLTFLETLTGVYVCSSFGKIRKPCIEFVISKAIELFFAIYLWACIRSIHKDMERVEEDNREEALLTKMVVQRVNFRRRRARSMIDQTTLYKTANLNYFELKDVPNIIFDMLKTEEELSQDSLVSPGMMLASVSNMGSYDYLKTSLSLGELGFMDLNSFQVVGLDDDRHLCPYKRAMKFLKLTRDDIQKAKELTKRDSFIKNYEAPEEVPWNIIDPKYSNIHARHQRQEEIFVAQLPDPDRVKDALKKKKRRPLPQDDILSDYEMSEEGSRASDEKIISLEEGEAEDDDGYDDESFTGSAETDGETTPDLWFMTNRKDEVNRISLFETHTSKRADNYERLYKQNFMSDIGPEVFDKASKLVKLTSLSDIKAGSSGVVCKAQTSRPSTSRDPDMKLTETAESDEVKEHAKSQKSKKKIAFEDHYESHTTMPLSITFTNFPGTLKREISKCEALYISHAVPKRSGILFLPDSSCELSSEKYDTIDACNEGSSLSIEISAPEVDRQDERPPPNYNYYHLERTKSNLLQRKFNLYVLKYFESMRSDFKHCHMNPNFHMRMSKKGSGVHNVDNSNLAVLKSSNFKSQLEENAKTKVEEFPYSKMHEQILFTRELMKKPIRDVLRSYYNLREMDVKYSNRLTREIYSFDSIRKSKKEIKADPKNSKCEKYLRIASNLQKNNVSDHEPEVYFIEEGQRSYNSVERMFLACPESEKMKFRPLYLSESKDMSWSDTPVNLNNSNIPFSRKCKNISGPSSSDWEEQETLAVNKSYDSSSELVSSSDLLVTCSKDDSLCSVELKTSIEITLKPSKTPICRTESGEFYYKNPGSTSLHVLRRFICPDHRCYIYKILNKERSGAGPNKNLPLLVNGSFTLNPSTAGKKIRSSSPETQVTKDPDLCGSLGNSCNNEQKTSNAESGTTHQKTQRYLIYTDRMDKESSLTCNAAGEKSKKWSKSENEEGRRSFELKHAISNETPGTSSAQGSTSAESTGIVHNTVAILPTNVLDEKCVQRVRQED